MIAARLHLSSEPPSQPAGYNVPPYHADFESMASNAQQQDRRDIILSSLNVAIEASNLAKDFCSITPAKPVFGTFSAILTMIKVGSSCVVLMNCGLIESVQESMMNDADCVELGLACADVCTALSRGLDGKSLKDLNDSVNEAIKQLTT